MSHLRSLSTKYRAVNLHNNHCARDLRSELDKLEQQRGHRLRELNQLANQVRRQSVDASASEVAPARPSRRASLTTSSLSCSPRPDLAKAPRSSDPSPRRNSQGTGAIAATQRKPAPKQKDQVAEEHTSLPHVFQNRKDAAHAGSTLSVMPQIVVSGHESDQETTDEVKGENGKAVNSSASASLRRSSLNSNGSVGSLNSDSSSVGQGQGSQLLDLPYQRSRSNSVPAVVPFPQPPQAKRRASYCPEPARNLEEMTSARDRSSGVSGILSTKRRGSLGEGKDLTADRDRSKAVRRRSIQLDRMLRNLSFGVQCYELDDPEERKGIDPREWEQLKKCRYLRVPGRDDTDWADCTG